MSPGCDACHERLDDFRAAILAHTIAHPIAHSGPALAVLVHDGGDMDELVAALRGTATVVVEDIGGPVSVAFGVAGFPVFALLDADGVIRASGFQLPLPAAT
jgi:hypothetical protein